MILNLRSIAVQSFLLLSFLMLSGCSKSDQVDGQVTAQAKTQAKTQVTAIANSTVQPSQIPKPLVTSQAVSSKHLSSKI
jgi:PBP1b-binding outer membrane lipoprotein LpoB